MLGLAADRATSPLEQSLPFGRGRTLEPWSDRDASTSEGGSFSGGSTVRDSFANLFDVLSRAGPRELTFNDHYLALRDEHRDLKKSLEPLKAENAVLRARITELEERIVRSARYTHETAPKTTLNIDSDDNKEPTLRELRPLPRPEGFKTWYPSGNGITKSSHTFLFDAENQPVTREVYLHIAQRARAALHQFLDPDRTWGRQSSASISKAVASLEDQFDILRLCADHWKAEAVLRGVVENLREGVAKKVKEEERREASRPPTGQKSTKSAFVWSEGTKTKATKKRRRGYGESESDGLGSSGTESNSEDETEVVVEQLQEGPGQTGDDGEQGSQQVRGAALQIFRLNGADLPGFHVNLVVRPARPFPLRSSLKHPRCASAAPPSNTDAGLPPLEPELEPGPRPSKKSDRGNTRLKQKTRIDDPPKHFASLTYDNNEPATSNQQSYLDALASARDADRAFTQQQAATIAAARQAVRGEAEREKEREKTARKVQKKKDKAQQKQDKKDREAEAEAARRRELLAAAKQRAEDRRQKEAEDEERERLRKEAVETQQAKLGGTSQGGRVRKVTAKGVEGRETDPSAYKTSRRA